MRRVETLNTILELPPAGRERSPRPRWLASTLIGFAILVVVVFGLLIFNWPFKRQAVTDALQQSSVKYVTIGHFYRTYFPPGCISEDIRFLDGKDKRKPPLIIIQRLTVQGSYGRIFTFQKHLSLVRVEGMHVTVPPKGPSGGSGITMPVTQTKSRRAMDIGTVIADGAVLDFLPDDGSRKPFHLVVNKLALDGIGRNQPLSYRATIFNPEPPGKSNLTVNLVPGIRKTPAAQP